MPGRRIALPLALAASALLTTAGATWARRLELSNQGFRLVWRELVFAEPSNVMNISCPVTMEGSFHSKTISKACGALVGYVTRVIKGACEPNGNLRLLSETVPWHVQYNSFAGTLPNIASLRLMVVGLSFLRLLEVLQVNCLWTSTQSRPWPLIATREGSGGITGIRSDESIWIPPGGISAEPCRELRLIGTGTVSAQGSSEPLTIRLVQ